MAGVVVVVSSSSGAVGGVSDNTTPTATEAKPGGRGMDTHLTSITFNITTTRISRIRRSQKKRCTIVNCLFASS